MMTKDAYNIGEVVKELKINKETIRYYERIGLLSSTRRDSNGYRIYSTEDIEKIRFIIIGKHFGFSLKEIKMLLLKAYDDIHCTNIEETKTIITSKINEINDKISELEETKNLLRKVNDIIASKGSECCEEVGKFMESNS